MKEQISTPKQASQHLRTWHTASQSCVAPGLTSKPKQHPNADRACYKKSQKHAAYKKNSKPQTTEPQRDTSSEP
jgi:hypothetical protein